MQEQVSEFWARYRAVHPDAPARPKAVFHFCDNQADADICADLVRATASSLAELALAGDPVPRAGDLSVVTDWFGAAGGDPHAFGGGPALRRRG